MAASLTASSVYSTMFLSSPVYGAFRVKASSQSTKKEQVFEKPKNQLFNNMFLRNTLLSTLTEKTIRVFDENGLLPKFLDNPLGEGKIFHQGLAFRQHFKVRSYEIGFDSKVTLATIMNYLQDAKVNHLKSLGILTDVLCVTPEMSRNNLKWVVTETDIVVDRYPSWREVIQVDTWTSRAGRNGVRCNWLFRDLNSGKAIIRVTSLYAMVDSKTRRISKFDKKMRKNLEPHFMHNVPFYDEEEDRSLSSIDESSADIVRRGLRPRWIDLRENMRVNNANYISWILEGTPTSIMESHELFSMKVVYQNECSHDSVIKSLSKTSNNETGNLGDIDGVKFEHALRLQNGSEIARARTLWRPKCAKSYQWHGAKLVEAKFSWVKI